MGKEYYFSLDSSVLILKPKADIRKVYLELSSRCNLSCPMCFKNTFRDPEGFMSMEIFEKILKDLREFTTVEHIIFGGIGESSMNENFFKMAELIKQANYMLTITTNGYFLNELQLANLVDMRIDEIVISVETGDIGHPSFRYVEQLLSKLQKIKERKNTAKPAVSIETVLTKTNYKDFKNIVNKLLQYDIRKVVISNLIPVYEQFVNLTLYQDDNKENDLQLRKEISSVVTAKVSAVLPNFRLKTERHCNFIENNATVIRWDGEVVPCYRFLHDGVEYVYSQKKEIHAHSFGNVLKSSLKDIWISKDYSWFRYKVKNAFFPSCTDCDLKNGCDFVKTTEMDCWGNSPSCADCIWWRNIVLCP